MEKKTIGKFISVLRRANGMTQKELGDRLFVSDKTVSRWERDECTPELSLIPVIAEIFGVTTDELLRGERNAPGADPAEAETAARAKTKSTKQMQSMLRSRETMYKNFCLISIGVGLLGLIAAAICNLGFTRGLLGFCLALIFSLAAVIVLLWFTNSLLVHPDEEDDSYLQLFRQTNHRIISTAVGVLSFHVILLAFILPIAVYPQDAYWGLSFGAWLLYGTLYAIAAAILCHITNMLLLRRLLTDRGLLYPDPDEQERFLRRRKLMKRTAAVLLCTELVLGLCMGVQNILGPKLLTEKQTFDNYEDFQAFMYEGSYRLWYANYIDDTVYAAKQKGDASVQIPIIDSDIVYDGAPSVITPEDADRMLAEYTDTIENENGEILCEYINYHFATYSEFSFDKSADGLPITVITRTAMQNAYHIHNDILSCISAAMLLDILICAAVYAIRYRRIAK